MARNRVPGGLARALEDYLTKVGYWQGPRRQTHAFTLSPDLCLLNKCEQEQLSEIAGAVRCFLEALERAMQMSIEPGRAGREWQLFRKFASAGIPRVFAKAQMRWNVLASGGGVFTPGVKIDLVRSTRGGFKIVEIDGWNPRGLAYSPFLHGLADIVRTCAAEEAMSSDYVRATPYNGVMSSLPTSSWWAREAAHAADFVQEGGVVQAGLRCVCTIASQRGD